MLTKKIKAINYNNGNINKVEEEVVEDNTLIININNKTEHKLSGITDSLYEFIIGYLFTENIVKMAHNINEIKIDGNKINVKIDNFSSKNNELKPVESNFKVNSEELLKRMDELKDNAKIWQATGGTHVAGIVYKDKFVVKEDVSRHVAVDKVIGYGILNKFDLNNSYVIYSGRMPADMVKKIVRVGIPVLASNAAPTYSGYEIAKKGNVTLVGFIRGQRFNIYNDLGRVVNYSNTVWRAFKSLSVWHITSISSDTKPSKNTRDVNSNAVPRGVSEV